MSSPLPVLPPSSPSPHPQGSIFPSSAIALYCAYLCFSALQSEPRDYACNGLGQRLTAASGGWRADLGRES